MKGKDMEKIKLELVGITYNQIESGVYAVILRESGGERRIPIVIGYPEAQAIECKLQEVVTPRPLSHDLMVSIMSSFGVSLHEVFIYRLPNGVFAAELLLVDGDREHRIDSRSSDAIALAIRTGAPMYTSREVLDEAGFNPGDTGNKVKLSAAEAAAKGRGQVSLNPDMTVKSLSQLEREMSEAAEREDYEEAARLKAEINTRKQSGEGGKSPEAPTDVAEKKA